MSTADSITRALMILLLGASLAACAEPTRRTDSPRRAPAKEVRNEPVNSTDRQVHVDLIQRMLDQQQYYAALAHVQQMQRDGRNTEQLRYLEAEARRELGQYTPAETLYRGLLRSKLAADAYHGLGLLYATRDMNRAIANLREATRLDPTDASSRNDLGYALMKMRRYTEAWPELATAVELDPANDKARNNLLLLLMVKGDEAGVRRMVTQAAVPMETVTRLRRDARAMQVRPATGQGVKR